MLPTPPEALLAGAWLARVSSEAKDQLRITFNDDLLDLEVHSDTALVFSLDVGQSPLFHRI